MQKKIVDQRRTFILLSYWLAIMALLLLLVTLLADRCAKPYQPSLSAGSAGLELACVFMRRHYSEHISLAQICRYAGLSNSAPTAGFYQIPGHYAIPLLTDFTHRQG